MSRLTVKDEADQELINHIAFVLDASSSMQGLRDSVIKVTDAQIRILAENSATFLQETRATVYQFASDVQCLYYDRDVYRFESIADRYSCGGMTALVSATLTAIEDLQRTPALYGRHSYLIFVITDGYENASEPSDLRRFKGFMNSLPEEYTVALLVPNRQSLEACAKLGFHPNNIQVWDPTNKGVLELGQKLQQVTTSYMKKRSVDKSFQGSKNVFDLDSKNVQQAVNSGGLKPLSHKEYKVFLVRNAADNPELFDKHGNHKLYIKPYFEMVAKLPYERGTVFYQPTKTVKVQPSKRILIREKDGDRRVFAGKAARQLLNLPDEYVSLNPISNPDYDIYVESTSDNRILFHGTEILYYTGD